MLLFSGHCIAVSMIYVLWYGCFNIYVWLLCVCRSLLLISHVCITALLLHYDVFGLVLLMLYYCSVFMYC